MHTDEWIALIEHLTTRPGMWVGRPDYEHIASFIDGYNHACGGALLAGFQEWLTMRFGRGHNVVWSALIRQETIESHEQHDCSSDLDDDLLLTTLRDLLTEYLRHRESIGLRNVYYDHGKWMRQFDWFNENVERYGSSEGPKETEQ